jgi:hypothetical protein
METSCGKGKQNLFDSLPKSVSGDTQINKSKYCVHMPAVNANLKHDQTTKAEIEIKMPSYPYQIESEAFYDYPFLQL